MALERISTQPHGIDEVLVTFKDSATGLPRNELLRKVPELFAELVEHGTDAGLRRRTLDDALSAQRAKIKPDDQNALQAHLDDAGKRWRALEDAIQKDRAGIDGPIFEQAERAIRDRAANRIAQALATNARERQRLDEDDAILKARAAREGKPTTIEE